MGVFAGSVGGRSRGGGGGYSSGGTGYGRVGSSRVSGGAASKEGTYVSGLGYVKYGSQSHKDIQQEYDKLAEAGNNLSPTQKKRMENLGYILEQIDNSITKGIPASYEDYVAKAKNLIGQGVSKEQALAGLDPDSSAYQSLSKAYDDAAWEQQQDFNEREAENARSKEASQKQAAQAQEAAQEEYDATHRHGLIKMFDDAGGFFGWVRGTRDRVFGR